MKIFSKSKKAIEGWGYWGNYGEIDIGFSSGLITQDEDYAGEKLHYHKRATTYMLILEGSGVVRVDGAEIEVQKDELLEIAPGERYQVLRAVLKPLRWITVSTNKEPGDKVIVDK